MRGHAGKKSSPWPQSLQKADANVYVRAGKSMGTSIAGMMMESMGLQPFHFSPLYNPPRGLTFRGVVPYPPPSLLTMTDKIEKEVVLQLMELVDDEMKNRHWTSDSFVSFLEVMSSVSIHVA